MIESEVPTPPSFLGFHLSNLWGESLDFESYTSNLNPALMEMTEDGVYRWVVAHRDPGVPNWIDTTGLESGFLSHRWAYSELPDKEDWPTITCRVIPVDEAADAFPADQPRVSRAERAEAIRIRERHVQKRFRVF